jgi:hypothetical protein
MNRETRWRGLGAAIAGCCGLTLATVGNAQEEPDRATLDLYLGAERSDNITRVPVDEVTDTTGIGRAAVVFEQHRPRLDTEITGDLQYRHYLDDTYDDEVVGGATADIGWGILPDRFVWVFQDNYGQIMTDPLGSDTPDNRESFNYFSTGPDITVPLGERTALLLSGRWSDTYYEDSPEGNQGIEGHAGIARKLSDQTTVSLNGSVNDITYDEDEIFPDYKITEGFMRMESESAQTTFSADLGYAEADRGGRKSDGPLVRLNVSRRITSRSTLTLDAGHEFDDTGQAFRVDQTGQGVGPDTDDTLAAGDVFLHTYGYLTLATEQERTVFSATVYGRKERHEDETELDRDLIGGSLFWSRRLSPRMDFDLTAGYSDEKFVTGDVAFKEWNAGAGIGWRFTEAVSMRLSITHFEGSGDGTVRDYDENRAYVGIRYSLGRRGP